MIELGIVHSHLCTSCSGQRYSTTILLNVVSCGLCLVDTLEASKMEPNLPLWTALAFVFTNQYHVHIFLLELLNKSFHFDRRFLQCVINQPGILHCFP